MRKYDACQIRVKISSGSKVIAAKKPNKPDAVMSVNQRTKEKKEEINNFCSFKDSSIFNLDFSV